MLLFNFQQYCIYYIFLISRTPIFHPKQSPFTYIIAKGSPIAIPILPAGAVCLLGLELHCNSPDDSLVSLVFFFFKVWKRKDPCCLKHRQGTYPVSWALWHSGCHQGEEIIFIWRWRLPNVFDLCHLVKLFSHKDQTCWVTNTQHTWNISDNKRWWSSRNYCYNFCKKDLH